MGRLDRARHRLHGQAGRRLPVRLRDERRPGDHPRAIPRLLATPTSWSRARVYRYEIDCWSSSNCFLAGHRIRVEIASSNFPQFDRNPNTGHAFGMDAELRPATQTVYHDAAHPSHIVLPIVD